MPRKPLPKTGVVTDRAATTDPAANSGDVGQVRRPQTGGIDLEMLRVKLFCENFRAAAVEVTA